MFALSACMAGQSDAAMTGMVVVHQDGEVMQFRCGSSAIQPWPTPRSPTLPIVSSRTVSV
jgi:hypothetical protein